MTRMLLVRHAQSTWNAQERWQGWADPPLSPVGERQAAEAAPRLADLGLTSIVSSDLVRASRTAEIVGAALRLGPVAIEPGLRERDVGEWSGFTSAEVDERWPGIREAWRAGRLLSPPGGESSEAFTGRVLEALGRLAAPVTADDPMLVITHGGVIRTLLRHVGVRSDPLGTLAGRWFDLEGTELRAGDPVEAGGPVEAGESE